MSNTKKKTAKPTKTTAPVKTVDQSPDSKQAVKVAIKAAATGFASAHAGPNENNGGN